MQPEDFLTHEFSLAADGFDRAEVRSFLNKAADEYARLIAELDAARSALDARRDDDFEHLGASVANVLRSAHETADTLTSEAAAQVDRARAEAEALVREARERVAGLESDAHERVAFSDEMARRNEAMMRARLEEANERISLALLALDDSSSSRVDLDHGSTELPRHI